LQYIGPFGNNSHSQTFVGISQKGSHLGSYSKESNPKAENEVHKNFDAHLGCSHKQAYKNTAIGDGTTLINEEGQPVGISLISDFKVTYGATARWRHDPHSRDAFCDNPTMEFSRKFRPSFGLRKGFYYFLIPQK
jgi:hypothetical protein